MGVPVEITDHEERAQAILASQFDDSDRLRALVACLASEVQTFEGVAYDCITEQMIDNAVGVQLDRWGQILGLPRTSTDDDDYRDRLKIEILVLRSKGGSAELQEIIARLVGEPVQYIQNGEAHLVLQYERATSTPAATIAAIDDALERAAPSGVAWDVTEGSDGDAFRFDTGPGFDDGRLGTGISEG